MAILNSVMPFLHLAILFHYFFQIVLNISPTRIIFAHIDAPIVVGGGMHTMLAILVNVNRFSDQ